MHPKGSSFRAYKKGAKSALIWEVDPLTCPKCGKGFAGNTVEVVDITGDRGTFAAHCRQCNAATLVTMGIREFRQKIAKRNKQISKIAVNKISPADVVELKDFLNDFNGDFRKLLDEPKKQSKIE